MSDDVRAVFVRVEGQVQGVGFRAFTASEASGLGVHGWVTNRDDGSVEAALHGPGSKLGVLIGRLRAGPTSAVVSALDVRSTDRSHGEAPPPGAHTF